jgi:hypothetical protein
VSLSSIHGWARAMLGDQVSLAPRTGQQRHHAQLCPSLVRALYYFQQSKGSSAASEQAIDPVKISQGPGHPVQSWAMFCRSSSLSTFCLSQNHYEALRPQSNNGEGCPDSRAQIAEVHTKMSVAFGISPSERGSRHAIPIGFRLSQSASGPGFQRTRNRERVLVSLRMTSLCNICAEQ